MVAAGDSPGLSSRNASFRISVVGSGGWRLAEHEVYVEVRDLRIGVEV